MRFWDSSALVPLLLKEAGSDPVRSIIAQDEGMIVWWGTEIEVLSAVRRREREGTLPTEAAERSIEILHELRRGWSQVLPMERTRAVAARLLAVHPLCAADAFQLAAALAWRRGLPGEKVSSA